MGGCASKPKETDGAVPVEAPANPMKGDAETVPQEAGSADEPQQEAPLVDLSEPKPESGEETVEAEDAKPAGELDALASEAPVEQTETKVKAAEDKPEDAKEVKEAVEEKSS